jgi:hypothetical protein
MIIIIVPINRIYYTCKLISVLFRVIKARRMRSEGACSTHGRDEKYKQNFGRKTLKEKTTQKT